MTEPPRNSSADSGETPAWHIHREVIQRADRPYDYQLWTALPARYARYPEADYPLLMCLDAQWTFGCATDAVRILASNGQLPRCIVAGLSFNTDHAREVAQLRARDFTLTQATAPARTGVRIPAEELGGAPEFAQFLLTQILPRLRSRYRVREQVFVGHSFSALLGLYLLLNHTGEFQRYLLASPSVWWDDRCAFDHFSQARRQKPEACCPGVHVNGRTRNRRACATRTICRASSRTRIRPTRSRVSTV